MNALVIGYGSIGKRHCRLLLSIGLEIHNIFVAELQKIRADEAQESEPQATSRWRGTIKEPKQTGERQLLSCEAAVSAK